MNKIKKENMQKLQKEYDEINNPNKTLEEIEKVSISDYQMKEGDYKIIITVYEANELEPRPAQLLFFDLNKTAVDGFVEIQVRGQTRKTAVRKETNNPIWQESFYFQFSNLSIHELDNSKIVFNVYDKNSFIIRNSMIGRIQLDWTNIYFRRFHEIYRGWLTLSDPNEENQGTVGYLLVNIAVLGPEDKVMVHDTAFIKDPLTTIEDTITNTKVRLIDLAINAEIYRAQSLIPLDLFSRNVDAYVVAKFSGNKVKTDTVTSLNPQWNKSLKIGTGVPNKTKYLLLQVWNHNYFPKKHDLIGTIKIPIIDVYEEKYNKPRWCHIYGPPMCAVDEPPSNYASKMQLHGDQLGSHYRGRLLFKITSKKYVRVSNGMSQIKFAFPYNPTPVVPLKTYTLSVELIEGFQLPERKQVDIVVGMGQYLIRSEKKFSVEKKMCEFHHIMADKKVQFPQEGDQVPDIIIYFCDGPEEKNRICFVRIKAADVITPVRHKQSDIYQFTGDKSLGALKSFEIGGYLNCRINLYSSVVPSYKSIQSDLIDKIHYDMYMYIFKGQDFPPAKIEGDCNPMLKFDCFGSTAKSTVKQGTYNPFWAETVVMKSINMQDLFTTSLTKGLVVEAFDFIDDNNDQFIGSFLIKLNNKNRIKFKPSQKDHVTCTKQGLADPQQSDFIYLKPKWYYIMNPHIQIGKHIFGRVLMSVALFKSDDLFQKIPKYIYDFDYRQQINKKKGVGQKYKKMVQFENRMMQIYVVGLRQIKDTSKNVLTKGQAELKISINGKDYKNFSLKSELKRSGCDFNKLVELEVFLPKNKTLVPFVDFKVIHNGDFYGFNSASLYKLLPKLKEKEGENNGYEDSEDSVLDIEGLQNQLVMLREKKKREEKEKKGDDGDNNNKNGSPDEAQIYNLQVPLELGVLNTGFEGKIQDYKFQDILSKAQLDIKDNAGFKYVRDLIQAKERKQKDSNAISNKQQEDGQSHSVMFNNSMMNNSMIPEMAINPDAEDEGRQDEKGKLLNVEKARDEASRYSNPSKGQQGSESKVKANLMPIEETVFQRRKRKLIEGVKDAKGAVKIVDLSRKRVGNQSAFSTKKQNVVNVLGEQLLNDRPDKPRMIPEEVPEEKHIQEGSQRISSELNKKKQIQGDPAGTEEQRAKHRAYMSKEEGIAKDYNQSVNKFSFYGIKNGGEEEENVDVHFEVKTESVYEDRPEQERAITYQHVQRVMKQEEKDQKEALEADKNYRFAQAVKLTLFGWTRKKKKRNVETYEDYDSEIGENLDIIPEWYKGRKILTSDFEDLSFKCSKIQTIPLFGGRLLEKTTIYQRYQQSAGHIKLLCLSEPKQTAKLKEEEYTKLLKPREFYCRIYCLKGKSLISHYQGKPTTFLKFSYADEEYSFQKTKTVENENNPEYYICQQIQVNLPGPSVIKIQVMETHDILGKLITKVLGFTEIDIEQRYFTKKWHLYEKKPIQLRNLYSEYGIGTQGRLETWIDLIEKKQWISTPAHKIHPPPFDKYELRVIVYSTDDCVYKNVQMESNDIFVRGVIGTSEPQETDTHWACRSVGNFNYRFKFPVFYPPKPEDMYSDIFAVQIWDRDLIGFNNLIGQTRINLNKIHKIIQKAVKRKKPVQASMKVKEKNFAITDRFWFDVYSHKEKDQFGIPQPQGRVQLSFQLVPFEQAEDALKNGYGRSEPNVYPTLAEPAGRLQFDFFSPLQFIKSILGPNLYRKWCCRLICCLIILIIALFGYIFFPALIAVKI